VTLILHRFTQAVYLDCDSENMLCFAMCLFLKSGLAARWKVMFLTKAKIKNNWKKRESVSPANPLSNVCVNNWIKSYLVRISKTMRDFKLYGIGKMSFIWCKSDDFYAISGKLCYECVKQDRFGIFLTHTEKKFVKFLCKGVSASVIRRQVCWSSLFKY